MWQFFFSVVFDNFIMGSEKNVPTDKTFLARIKLGDLISPSLLSCPRPLQHYMKEILHHLGHPAKVDMVRSTIKGTPCIITHLL
jgi:hypothetical protein